MWIFEYGRQSFAKERDKLLTSYLVKCYHPGNMRFLLKNQGILELIYTDKEETDIYRMTTLDHSAASRLREQGYIILERRRIKRDTRTS